MVASSEGVAIDDESLHVIAHKADGAMRDALTIFDQTVAFCGTDVKYQDVLRNLNVLDYEYSFSLVDAFLKGDYPSALTTFDEILTKGFNALHFVAALSSHMRDLIVSKSGGLDSLLELPDSLKKRYKEQADRCPLQFLYDGLGITTSCESGYRASINPRLHIEFALMRLAFLMNKPAAPVVSAPAPAAQVTQIIPSAPAAAPAPVVPETPKAPVTPQTPVAPSAPEVQETPAMQTTPAVQETPVPEAPVKQETEQAPVPRERRTRGARAATTGLSMKSVMSDAPESTQVISSTSPAPTEELVKEKWPEFTAHYQHMTRLHSMLNTTTLTVTCEEDHTIVEFLVVNVAQKTWVESKVLHEMEGQLRSVLNSAKVSLRVEIAPDDSPQERKIYMPEEQVGILMKDNPEVTEFVKTLELETK